MLARLKVLFASAEPRPHSRDELRVAAAALLAEAARLDGHIQPREREAIERVLARRFELAPDETPCRRCSFRRVCPRFAAEAA